MITRKLRSPERLYAQFYVENRGPIIPVSSSPIPFLSYKPWEKTLYNFQSAKHFKIDFQRTNIHQFLVTRKSSNRLRIKKKKKKGKESLRSWMYLVSSRCRSSCWFCGGNAFSRRFADEGGVGFMVIGQFKLYSLVLSNIRYWSLKSQEI